MPHCVGVVVKLEDVLDGVKTGGKRVIFPKVGLVEKRRVAFRRVLR
jgi:hypothetical protein